MVAAKNDKITLRGFVEPRQFPRHDANLTRPTQAKNGVQFLDILYKTSRDIL